MYHLHTDSELIMTISTPHSTNTSVNGRRILTLDCLKPIAVAAYKRQSSNNNGYKSSSAYRSLNTCGSSRSTSDSIEPKSLTDVGEKRSEFLSINNSGNGRSV